MYYVYPQKFCLSIVFNFCCDDCNTQEKLKTMLLQYFGVKMVNMKRRASGLTLKKRPKGYSEMDRYFSRSS